MPCPHHDIKIVQRSNRQSAVAAAAYQSGERLFSEYDQKQKYYAEKRGIVHTEIMLPQIKTVSCSINVLVIHKIYLCFLQATGHAADFKYLTVVQCVRYDHLFISDRTTCEQKRKAEQIDHCDCFSYFFHAFLLSFHCF